MRAYRETIEVQPHLFKVGESERKFFGKGPVEPIPVQAQHLQLIQIGQRRVDVPHCLDIAERASQVPGSSTTPQIPKPSAQRESKSIQEYKPAEAFAVLLHLFLVYSYDIVEISTNQMHLHQHHGSDS